MSFKKIGHRMIALLLALSLVLSLPLFMPSESYGAARFMDISDHWAEKFISRAYNLDIVGGYPNGKFMPDKAVTRAEFVSMVNQALDLDTSASSNFKDVLPGHWYYNDVSEAVAATYASGYSDNTFRPNTYITRQEAAVMLARILPASKEKGSLKSFRDNRLIADWATAAMEKMTGRQYMGAYDDGRIHPADPLTRAQTAKILCDILDNETIENQDRIVDENNTTLTERIYVGDVTIDEDLGEGNATIDNCVIMGTLSVEGGGAKSITINNSRVGSMVVRKDDTPVRIVTKGDTIIPKVTAYGSSILQTSGKNGLGVLEVTVNRGADLTLKGNFPAVNINGSSSTVTLESGKIGVLTVDRSGKYSDITLTGKAEVTEATVNGEAYFHGTGTIVHMSVNADNITYETKPKKMTVGVNIDRALGEADIDSDVEVEFDPGNKDTDVDLDTKITLTFNTSIKLANGAAVTSSNIKNFASIHTASKGGIEVECTGTINTAKKVVTLTPKNELSANTRYYVVLADESVMNAGGSKNDEDDVYFTTGSSGSNSLATYSPRDGASGISTDTSITIKFSRDVVKYSDGKEVTDSYLPECIVFKAGDAGSGTAVAYTATISSEDKITIKPSASLTPGQTYSVAVVANKLKTKDGGKAISGSSSTWRVAPAVTAPSAAVLSTLTLAPAGGSNILTGFSASKTDYDLTVPFGTTGVDVTATAVSGTSISINGTSSASAIDIPVAPSAVTTINIAAASSGLATTTYRLNVEVAGNTTLSAISVNGMTLQPIPDPYTANVPAAATSASITVSTVDPNATIKIGTNGNTGTGTLTSEVSLSPGNQSITFTVTSNRTTKTYTIYISRLAS